MKARKSISSKVRQSPDAILESARQDLGASSCTFWVRDPWWPDQFVQLFMPGVTITEPMHGFVLPFSSYKKVAGPNGGAETYFSDAVHALELRDDLSPPLDSLVKENKIFGDFVHRESVASCSRFRHFSPDGKVDAVLWVNFTKPRRRFEKQKMRDLMSAMVDCLPDTMDRLRIDNPFPSAQIVEVLKPAENLATIGQSSLAQSLEWYLNDILDALLRAFNISEETGLGTVHLFDPKRQVLRRIAHKGTLYDHAPLEQEVSRGDGVITWVALKRRAILISELRVSPFQDIFKQIAPGVESELAVPMLAGDELLGVLNLESKVSPGPFSRHSVRTIWYAASQAAIACRLFHQVTIAQHQTERTSKLLKIAHKAVLPAGTSEPPLVELENLAQDWLQAAGCDIWQYRESLGEFTDSGHSFGQVSTRLPRETGWSDYVRITKTPVWISKVAGVTHFECKFWNQADRSWTASPPRTGAPDQVNQRLVETDVRCELGMPIQVGDRCIGIAWLKYADENTPEPTAPNMGLADGFAAQAGLVIDVLQRYQDSVQMEQGLRQFRDTLFPSGAFSFPGVDGFVIRRASGEVGGDFHAYHAIDPKRTCFLVGDAEGHGTVGALRMLPMITTFDAFAGESSSTKHTLWRLVPVCERWQLRGTAICFIIDISSRKPLIFASSAGHHSLIIANEHGQVIFFPNEAGVANRGALGAPLDLPMGEAFHELSSGDLIVAYTDGVIESANKFAEAGPKGIVEAVLASSTGTPQDIAKTIEERTLPRDGDLLHDDATIMVLRIH